MADIVNTDDVLGGAPRIEGRRIGVHHVAGRIIDDGVAPEQVAVEYDLDLADIHRALAYYYDHPDEMQSVRSERSVAPDHLDVIESPDDLEEGARNEA